MPAPPASARLKIHKAMYGTRVFLNGQLVGDHLPCFTPAEFDVRRFLAPPGATERAGDPRRRRRGVLPKETARRTGPREDPTITIPGIYDSVELILSGLPRIANVQTVPDVEGKAVRVVAEIEGAAAAGRSV